MKKYVSPTSCNASNGGVRGAIPAILGMIAGAVAAGAAGAAVKKMFSSGVVPKDNFLKISSNLKIE